MYYDKLIQTLSQNLAPLPSDGIEAALSIYPPYQPDATLDTAAETGNVPPFVIPFYALVLLYGAVPSPTEFVSAYFSLYGPERWSHLHNGLKRGVEARLNRAYPSLVRDLHLWALLHESGLATWYSLGRDRQGVDLTVQDPFSKQLRFIHAFIDTPRAWAQRANKPTGPNHVDLPLSFREAKDVNGYLLYQGLHVDRVWASFGGER